MIRPGFELLLQFLLVLSYMLFVNEPLLLEILLRSKPLQNEIIKKKKQLNKSLNNSYQVD